MRSGIPSNLTGYGHRREATRMGKVAFFADEILTTPFRVFGPSTISLSIDHPII
jgi:hypothetical protein